MPMKSRKGEEITNTWKELHDMHSKAGVAPKMMILDNEMSLDLKQHLVSTSYHTT